MDLHIISYIPLLSWFKMWAYWKEKCAVGIIKHVSHVVALNSIIPANFSVQAAKRSREKKIPVKEDELKKNKVWGKKLLINLV